MADADPAEQRLAFQLALERAQFAFGADSPSGTRRAVPWRACSCSISSPATSIAERHAPSPATASRPMIPTIPHIFLGWLLLRAIGARRRFV